MSNKYNDFELSAVEAKYLEQIVARDTAIASLIRSAQKHKRPTMRLNRDEAEKLRDYLTMQLASTGFDQNYLPNKEGHVLETLIDRFYFPNS